MKDFASRLYTNAARCWCAALVGMVLSMSAGLAMAHGVAEGDQAFLRQNQGIFDPGSLGFSSSTDALFGDFKYFPRIEPGARKIEIDGTMLAVLPKL